MRTWQSTGRRSTSRNQGRSPSRYREVKRCGSGHRRRFSWGWRSWRSVHGRARPCSRATCGSTVANGINLTDEQGITITAPAVGERTVRRFLEATGDWAGTGLADAAHDLLTADSSTMSSTYQTLLSATVDVDEQGDRVLIDVTGQLGWMGTGLFVGVTVFEPQRVMDAVVFGC